MIESLDQEIRTLRAHYWSARDPEGRGFAPLAEAYRLQGEIDEAASLVQDGLERLPGFVAGYLVASRIARDRGDLLGSRGMLDRALDLDPENVVARFERATLALEERDREGALADLRTVLDLDPNHQAATRRLEEIESGLGWESEHLVETESLTESESVEVESPLAPMSDAILLTPVELPPPPRPVDASDAPESQDDGEDRALFTRTMGDLYAAQGFLDRAVEVYRHLSAADPDDDELRDRLAELSARVRSDGGGDEEELAAPLRPMGGRILSGTLESAGFGGGERPVRSYFEDLLAWIPGAVPISLLAPDPIDLEEAPIPIELLAPEPGEALVSALDISEPLEYPELGIPVPVEFLAPDSDEPHGENLR